MKRIYLLFAIFIILILFVGLTNVSAVDSSKWKIVSIEGENFKIPPEYEGGELDNDSYYDKNSKLYIRSYKTDYHLLYRFGEDYTSKYLEDVKMDKIESHDVLMFLSCFEGKYSLDIYFMCGNSTYYISQEGDELNENVKEIIRTSPKQNLTSQEFYAEFYKLQMRYAKYLDDIEWVSNDLQQFENQKNLERQAQNDNMYWYLFGDYSNNY